MSKNNNPQVSTKTNIQEEIPKVQIATPTKNLVVLANPLNVMYVLQ
jgi:hypothetical protein